MKDWWSQLWNDTPHAIMTFSNDLVWKQNTNKWIYILPILWHVGYHFKAGIVHFQALQSSSEFTNSHNLVITFFDNFLLKFDRNGKKHMCGPTVLGVSCRIIPLSTRLPWVICVPETHFFNFRIVTAALPKRTRVQLSVVLVLWVRDPSNNYTKETSTRCDRFWPGGFIKESLEVIF